MLEDMFEICRAVYPPVGDRDHSATLLGMLWYAQPCQRRL